ncbi:chemotaxis protein CheW [Pseudoduganella violacea]|uniref:Purine-binding chemotaxis protein CheW n=1 Tax=Pseudoduganella violacea TaxID=1715466 RepID=A0A7W5BEP7_9BURK|nr:purine-binding chemotaxis protein CheW [Pseudoduganella violacea]
MPLAAHRSAQTLREQFDRGFALALAPPVGGSLNVLIIRIGSERFAVALPDIQGLYVDRTILALPSPMPELLGVANFRGQIVPVYQLASLIGKTGAAAPRWMVLVQERAPLAFAFDAFEAHLCAGARQLLAGSERAVAEQAFDAVHTENGVVPLLPVRTLAGQIAERTAGPGPGGGHG